MILVFAVVFIAIGYNLGLLGNRFEWFREANPKIIIAFSVIWGLAYGPWGIAALIELFIGLILASDLQLGTTNKHANLTNTKDHKIPTIKDTNSNLSLTKYTPKTSNNITSTRNRNKTVKVKEGYCRTFVNVHIDGEMHSMGIPKHNAKVQDVWIGKDCKEVTRVSIKEAKRMTGNSIPDSLLPNKKNKKNYSGRKKPYEGLPTCSSASTTPRLYGNKSGKCVVCGKKLRGNTKKTHCTVCYNAYK